MTTFPSASVVLYRQSLVARANRFARVTEWFPVINLVEKVGQ
ncbi:Uncharacterised protein [Vibrio cholerae]|nr:Uncharacterised protein [Vibrio cholerae]